MRKRKLVLNKETVRKITADDLRDAFGGDLTSVLHTVCASDCPQCPSEKYK